MYSKNYYYNLYVDTCTLFHGTFLFFLSPRDSIPLELLVNIDNFAHAVKLTWQTEDNVIAVLQSLGASTFLALLERSHLMDTLTRQGDRVGYICVFVNSKFLFGIRLRALNFQNSRSRTVDRVRT